MDEEKEKQNSLYDFDLEKLNGDTWDEDFIKLRDKVQTNEVYAKFVVVLCKTLIGNEKHYIDIKTINHYVKKSPDYINKLAETFISLEMLVKSQRGRKNYYIINFAHKEDWEFLLKKAVKILNLIGNKKEGEGDGNGAG